MVKTKKIGVFAIFVFCLLSSTTNSNTCVIASELQEEEMLQIDFAKIRETFFKGNYMIFTCRLRGSHSQGRNKRDNKLYKRNLRRDMN